MKKLEELMKSKEAKPMPEMQSKARMQLIQDLKKLARDLLASDLQSKLGSPDAVAIKIKATEMSPEEAMEAPMDMFREKEDVLLREMAPKMEDSEEEDEDEMEEDDSEDSEEDLDKLRMLLKQKKQEDSDY